MTEAKMRELVDKVLDPIYRRPDHYFISIKRDDIEAQERARAEVYDKHYEEARHTLKIASLLGVSDDVLAVNEYGWLQLPALEEEKAETFEDSKENWKITVCEYAPIHKWFNGIWAESNEHGDYIGFGSPLNMYGTAYNSRNEAIKASAKIIVDYIGSKSSFKELQSLVDSLKDEYRQLYFDF